ncbi:MAG: hypothetical protein K2X63_01360 [Burkholderiaceae bacterium]|jgi:hypothetical protein|nr:hypothetical protein [Burkholderiaceae bacterium]
MTELNDDTKQAPEEKPEENTADSLLSEIASMATEGVKQGKRDAEDMADRAIPAIKLGLEKASYSTSYYLTFGLIFTGKLLFEALPKDGALRQGAIDGAVAAKDAFERRKEAVDFAKTVEESVDADTTMVDGASPA